MEGVWSNCLDLRELSEEVSQNSRETSPKQGSAETLREADILSAAEYFGFEQSAGGSHDQTVFMELDPINEGYNGNGMVSPEWLALYSYAQQSTHPQ
jgi:hypothetical protein